MIKKVTAVTLSILFIFLPVIVNAESNEIFLPVVINTEEKESNEQLESTPSNSSEKVEESGKTNERNKYERNESLRKGEGILHAIMGAILLPLGIVYGNLDAIDKGLGAIYRAGLIGKSLSEQKSEGSDDTPTASSLIENMKSSD